MIKAIVIGGSAGSLQVMIDIISQIKNRIGIPIIVVLHLSEESNDLPIILEKYSLMDVKEAEDKEKIIPNKIYIAPASYHLQIEGDQIFSLSTDDPVNYARPSIDVLFSSAAEIFQNDLVGILLTGANVDGAEGLRKIEDFGGKAFIQDPSTAYMQAMPKAGIKNTKAPKIMSIKDIINYIKQL